mmetsp:Transcript_62692/g.149567  ORF Transcript_62692/g.149567 Transcript_62692/m.149567 type:complete len:1050 (-) Transcript_62692:53-3202(-)
MREKGRTQKGLLLAPPASELDADASSCSNEALGDIIVRHLAVKGYCLVQCDDILKVDLAEAVRQARELCRSSTAEKVPPVIAEGLLGLDGSDKIVKLDSEEEDHPAFAAFGVQEKADVGPELHHLDEELTQMADIMLPHLWRIRCETSGRTTALLHRGGDSSLSELAEDEEDEDVLLLEGQADRWLRQFMYHRVMLILVIGPGEASVELEPFVHDDSDLKVESVTVEVKPGMLLAVRPDMVSRKVFASEQLFTITSFLLQRPTGREAAGTDLAMNAPTAILYDWMQKRMEELKSQSEQTLGYFTNLQLPRAWQKAMNLKHSSKSKIAVRGAACKMPVHQDLPGLYGALTEGLDAVTEIPQLRWNNADVYDPDPQSWKNMRIYSRHGAFMDGLELFDHKFFGISLSEAKGVDPAQRCVLEVGYAAMHAAGWTKKLLTNVRGGGYIGAGESEWAIARDSYGADEETCCGTAPSITANRLNFCLGMRGPSMAVDTEASSGLLCIYLAGESLQAKQSSVVNVHAVAEGVNTVVSPNRIRLLAAQGWMSKVGRCMPFDQAADGYPTADGVGAVSMKAYYETNKDGVESVDDSIPLVGLLAGASTRNCSNPGILGSIDGAAEQDIIQDSLRSASIAAEDVDAVEVHAQGLKLQDAIEAVSTTRAYRSQISSGSIFLTSAKSCMANSVWGSSAVAFLKALYASRFGTLSPICHLREVNSFLEASSQTVPIIEAVDLSTRVTCQGVMAHGLGGTSVHALALASLDDSEGGLAGQRPALYPVVPLLFWPGGTGEPRKEAMPKKGFFINGSWSCWAGPEPMNDDGDGDGNFSFVIVLGENRLERFQIWLDADSQRVLHPSTADAPKDEPLQGPSKLDESNGLNWLLEGREEVLGKGHPDAGESGDVYAIRLMVRGQWRTVTWERLASERLPRNLAAPQPSSKYYLVASWNNWSFEEMSHDVQDPGKYTFEADLVMAPFLFQIVRNKDWGQRFYPSRPYADSADVGNAYSILGPDSMGDGMNWEINSRGGQTFRITFNRSKRSGEAEKLRVSWEALPVSS